MTAGSNIGSGPSSDSLPEGPLALADRPAIRDICERLAEQARRELLIFSPDLDPYCFDRPPFLAAVRRLALDAPHLPVRALLLDPRTAVAAGHRLIDLARRLSSRIAIRRASDEDRERSDAFVIADGRGYCLRRPANAREAVADLNNPREARLLREDFERMWERGDADTELRRLYI